MRQTPRCITGLVVLAGSLALPATALANPYDISLRGLGDPRLDPTAADRFRLLTTELAFTLAPRPMQPAETLGMSGFEISVANSLTDINESAPYWQGQPGSPIFEAPLHGRDIPKVLWTPTVHMRKGLPLSSEIGIQGTYLSFSELFLVGAELKVALHESFFRWFPVLSGRVAFGRLFGSTEIDMVTAEADAMASVAFGVGGMTQLTPYLGFGELFAHVNSQVLDSTPYLVTDGEDQSANGSLYSFETIPWNENRYHRIFGGLRINVAMIEVLFEANYGLVPLTGGKNIGSYSLKLGFDV